MLARGIVDNPQEFYVSRTSNRVVLTVLFDRCRYLAAIDYRLYTHVFVKQ